MNSRPSDGLQPGLWEMLSVTDDIAGLVAILGLFAFGLGACVGSFLNVVIWRVPRGESIVRPPSHCPKCGAAIRWYQNIPILSWLALRGRCANCRAPISPRYILVEAVTACLFLAAFLKCCEGGAISIPLDWWIWISLMIVGSAIDFYLKLLPDFVTVGGMALGVTAAAARSLFLFATRPSAPLLGCATPILGSLAGLAFGFGLLWLVRFLGSKAFGREAMGMGDVFLMGAVGAVFGPTAVVVTLILSSVAGSVVGLFMIALAKTRLGAFAEIPFGPYICLGCLGWMFFGSRLVGWYTGLMGF